MLKGKIACIGLKYVIEGDHRHLKPSPLLHTLLPGDIVGYKLNPITNKLQVTELISRTPIKTLGIIKPDLTICYPLLPDIFNLVPDLIGHDLTKPTCVILIESQGPKILSQWDQLSLTRANDWKIILDLYKPIDSLVPKPDIILDKKRVLETDHIQDLTHLNTFNIDPPESKDFDDAISIDMCANKIYVHIVDAHNQITPGSTVDTNALAQSFTLYLPEHIHNILPIELSNDQLSLIQSQRRKTVTIEYTLDSQTLQIDSSKTQVYLGIITIKTRYDYDSFDSWIQTQTQFLPWLKKFLHTYKLTSRPVDLDTPSLRLQINPSTGNMQGYQIDLSQMNSSISHQLITWLMIFTNITVSKLIEQNIIPQRYHSKSYGKLDTDTNLIFQDLTDCNHINIILGIKKFRKAIYSSTQSGHSGLQVETYTHFTSPIRRYFDVIIHRILNGSSYSNLSDILEYINKREIYIDSIVKLYSRLKILSYLESNKEIQWIGYWIPQGLILKELLFEIKYYPIDSTKLYTQVKIKISGINWDKLEPTVKFI